MTRLRTRALWARAQVERTVRATQTSMSRCCRTKVVHQTEENSPHLCRLGLEAQAFKDKMAKEDAWEAEHEVKAKDAIKRHKKRESLNASMRMLDKQRMERAKLMEAHAKWLKTVTVPDAGWLHLNEGCVPEPCTCPMAAGVLHCCAAQCPKQIVR